MYLIYLFCGSRITGKKFSKERNQPSKYTLGAYTIQIIIFIQLTFALKTPDTIGNYQRPVFSLGVSQRIHIITNL